MFNTNGMNAYQKSSQSLITQPNNSSIPTNQNLQRRSANYKPNIWNYDRLQSLTSEFMEKKYERLAEKLKDEVVISFMKTVDVTEKMEFIDILGKLGLAHICKEEINMCFETIIETIKTNQVPVIGKDLYATSLCFRLLRQHGYYISQDVFRGFTDGSGNFMKCMQINARAPLELLEASNFATEAEQILDGAADFVTGILRSNSSIINDTCAKKLELALELPLQRRVEWYDVKRNIQNYEKQDDMNPIVLKLAKLNFNMIQATHQKDLKDISRWWKDLGIAESLSFTRNRIVESYLWTVGVAFDTNYTSFRKCLTKTIKLILIIDDVYDVYGSLEELELFTSAINRWDSDVIQKLPECMKICFETLYDTTNEIASDIQKGKDGTSVLPMIRKVWEDFCNALLVEARWYNVGYTPSLKEYLDNGWISSSGPVLSLHALLSVTTGVGEKEALALWRYNRDLVYYSSLIIRLCNDQGTSTVELERGDAPSSILCFMREAGVSEIVARKHIRSIITRTWKNINEHCINKSTDFKPFTTCVINTARVAHFIYQNGDGFGVQDRETRDQVLALLFEHFGLEL